MSNPGSLPTGPAGPVGPAGPTPPGPIYLDAYHTGGTFDAALAAAIAACLAAPGNNKPNIYLTPGTTYQFTNNQTIPGGIGFTTDAGAGGARLYFPTDTGAPGIALTPAIAMGATTIALQKATGSWTASGKVFIPDASLTLSYTGRTIAGETVTLTGVTGVTVGIGAGETVVQGFALQFGTAPTNPQTLIDDGVFVQGPSSGSSAWATSTPPDSLDGIFMPPSSRVNGEVAGFRMGVTWNSDHQKIGRAYQAGGCWAAMCAASPRESNADQTIEAGGQLDGTYWCGIYVSSGNYLGNLSVGKSHWGESPWWIFKQAMQGRTDDQALIHIGCHYDTCSIEGWGVGIIGAEDGISSCQQNTFTNCSQQSYAATTGITPDCAFIVGSIVDDIHDGADTMFYLGLQSFSTGWFRTNQLQMDASRFDAPIAGPQPILLPRSHDADLTICGRVSFYDTSFRMATGHLWWANDGANIAVGDVCGVEFYGLRVEQFQRTYKCAGVAVTASATGENSVVVVQQTGNVNVNVKTGNPAGTQIPSTIGLVRTDPSANGKAVLASGLGDTAGPIIGSTWFCPDDGTHSHYVTLAIPL